MMDNMTVIVCSCDGFEDVWEPCSKSIKKNWRDCPYEIILVTEKKKSSDELVFSRTIATNCAIWTRRVFYAVEMISTPYIFFMLDDHWPVKKVSQKEIQNIITYMENNTDVGVVYLEHSKGDDFRKMNLVDDYYEIPFGETYRLACAPSIWRRERLLAVMDNDCSAWDFERKISFDKKSSGFRVLKCRNNYWNRLTYAGGIHNGKWMRDMRNYSKELEIDIDYSKRQEETVFEVLLYRFKAFIFNINPTIIVKIQRWLNC